MHLPCRKLPMRNAVALAAALFCFSAIASDDSQFQQHTLERAVKYLVSQQQEDGAWRSLTYAQLKTGQALTPFVFDALLRAEAAGVKIPARQRDAARAYILKHVDAKTNFLGFDDPGWPEYPTYATAYGLMCLTRLNDPRDTELIARMAKALAESQFSELNGVAKEHPAYGGWGFSPLKPKDSTGHMDLAHSRRVLEALRAAKNCGATISDDVFVRARSFLSMVQRHPDDTRVKQQEYDGGFYLSPVVTPANKGGLAPASGKHAEYYRSYATATADGLLALLAAGVPASDERVKKAESWLNAHREFDYPAGVPEDHPDGMGHAIHFYHFAVRAEALSQTDAHEKWQTEIAALLFKQQQKDGCFENKRNALMKENDPLLCTTLAVVALSEAIKK